MEKLTETMKKILANHPLGFVATVNEDGTPNLSPKGTFLLLDEQHLIFAEIRSPNTLNNLKHQPALVVNFIDVLARKGFRVAGTARFLERGTSDFEKLFPLFERWGDLTPRINGIVKIHMEEADMLISPAYDIGATEEELRSTYKNHFLGMVQTHE